MISAHRHLLEDHQVARDQHLPSSATRVRTYFSTPICAGSLLEFSDAKHEAIEPFHIAAMEPDAFHGRFYPINKTLASTVFPPKPPSILKAFPAEKAGKPTGKFGEMLIPFPLKQVFDKLMGTVFHLNNVVEHFCHKQARHFDSTASSVRTLCTPMFG